jgi:hypothetical protein
MEISSCSKGEEQSPDVMRTSTGGQEEALGRFFLPPVIEATGLLATGATTESLRKQNKYQRTEALLRQPITSQWKIHHGNTILPDDHWGQQSNTSEVPQMAPQGLALLHEAAGILSEWEKFGCPTRTGRD